MTATLAGQPIECANGSVVMTFANPMISPPSIEVRPVNQDGEVIDMASSQNPARAYTLSPELTFIPRKAPYEILDRSAGERLVKRLNRHPALRQTMVLAKLDSFHQCYLPIGTKGKSWCVEIVPHHSWRNHWFYDSKEKGNEEHGKGWIAEIDALFAALRDDFDLVPSVSKRRGTTVIDYPTGGCHIQYGADIFDAGINFYKQMERFHRNLYMDLANRPYIRWLFAQWSDEMNHGSIVDRNTLVWMEDRKETQEEIAERVYGWSFHTSSINPRFMRHGKQTYGTFEFRAFNAVENGTELAAIVKFLDAWVHDLRRITILGMTLPFTLTVAQWNSWECREYSLTACKNLIDMLGLQWQDYEVFYNRNYLKRLLAKSFA